MFWKLVIEIFVWDSHTCFGIKFTNAFLINCWLSLLITITPQGVINLFGTLVLFLSVIYLGGRGMSVFHIIMPVYYKNTGIQVRQDIFKNLTNMKEHKLSL